MAAYDMTGTTFGQWVVLWPTVRTPRNQIRYVCQCSCGKIRVNTADNLTRGLTSRCISCSRRVHGRYGTPEYKAYFQAKDRCRNPNCSSYPDYGGRGIRFQFKTFQQWLAVLGTRPEGHSVDRIDNDGPYSPSNVRWATQSQQNYNRRRRAC